MDAKTRYHYRQKLRKALARLLETLRDIDEQQITPDYETARVAKEVLPRLARFAQKGTGEDLESLLHGPPWSDRVDKILNHRKQETAERKHRKKYREYRERVERGEIEPVPMERPPDSGFRLEE
jgi:hypothetical protein